MLDKLQAICNKYEELSAKSEQPDFYADPQKAARLLREKNDLEPIVEAFHAYNQAQQDMADAQELMADPEMKELCQETYAAAKARDVLGGMPDKVEIGVSSNIIKNVKSVIVPNTDGMKGIEAAASAGIVGGQADKALEVIAAVTTDQKAAMRAFLKQVPVTVKAIDNGFIFDIIVTLQQGSDSAVVRIC